MDLVDDVRLMWEMSVGDEVKWVAKEDHVWQKLSS
jgi:hypothetical protein